MGRRQRPALPTRLIPMLLLTALLAGAIFAAILYPGKS